MRWAQSCIPVSQRSLSLCRALWALFCQAAACPGSGQCPVENTAAKEAKSSSPHLLPQKKNPRKRTHFFRNWNHCLCMLVLTWGVDLWLEVRDMFTQVHQSISPTTWVMHLQPPLFWGFKRSEIKMYVQRGSWGLRGWCVAWCALLFRFDVGYALLTKGPLLSPALHGEQNHTHD